VFSFVLAVTKVNAYLAYQFFCCPDPVPTLQKFCHKLAWELIKNKWLAREDLDESHVVTTVHQLMRAQNNAAKYVNGRWLAVQCKTATPELPVHVQTMWCDTQTHQNLLLLLPRKVDMQVLPCCAHCKGVETGI
jgi:hypothetical protein